MYSRIGDNIIMVEGSRTEQELLNAFAGESQARNRYTFYAKVAKKEGYEQISQIFLDTAENEREHAKLFFEHIPSGVREVKAKYPFFLGNTKENLKAAFEGERDEWENIYKNSAEIAKSEGYKEIADLFSHVIEVEKHHSHRYSELLKLLEEDEVFTKNSQTQWMCRKCGYITISKCAPKKCPLCDHPQGYFEVFCEKF